MATIAVTVAAFVLIGWAVVALVPPLYSADASILLDLPHRPGADTGGGVSADDDGMVATQVSVIASRSLLARVFEDRQLSGDPEFAYGDGLLSRLSARFTQPSAPSGEAAFRHFRERVSVSREGHSHVIDITVSSSDADKAARLANTIADTFTKSLAGASTPKTAESNPDIEALRQKVGDAERAATDFEAANGDGIAAAKALKSRLDALSGQVRQAHAAASRASNRYRQAREAGHSAQGMIKLADIVRSRTADALRDSYNSTAAALADAQKVYGPLYPAIRRMTSQMADLRAEMRREARRIIAGLKGERDGTAQTARSLQNELDALRERSEAADRARARLAALQRDTQAARADLDAALARQQQMAKQAAEQAPQARIISSAVPPVDAGSPKPETILPLAALLGLIAGCVVALVHGPRRPARDIATTGSEDTGPANGDPASPPLAATVTAGNTEPLRPAVATPAAIAEPSPLPPLASLGSYDVPAAPGSTARSIIKAIRLDLQETGSSELSQSVLQLLRRLVARLHQHQGPFVLAITSLEDTPDRKLAIALIGIGLRSLDEKVLVLEIADRAEGPSPLTSVSSRRGTAIFTDPASGLQTIVVGSGHRVGDIVARYREDFDFVLVFAHPLADAQGASKAEYQPDLVIVALPSRDTIDDPRGILADRIARAGGDGIATLVINRVEAGRHSDEGGPRLVVSSPMADKHPGRKEG